MPLNYAVIFAKSLVPALGALAFGLYKFTATDYLYYLLIVQLLCLGIHILLPEEESSYTLFEDRLSHRLLNSTRSLIKQDDQLKFFKAHHIKVKKIIKSIKNEYGRTREFIYVVFIYSAVSICNTAINFGLNHIVGSIYINALVLALADVMSLLARCCIYRKVKEKEVYTINIVISSVLIATAVTVIVTQLSKITSLYSLFSNEYLLALILFSIRLGLNLQQHWILTQTEKFFHRKSHYYEVHSLSDTISKFVCIIVPMLAQIKSSVTVHALIAMT